MTKKLFTLIGMNIKNFKGIKDYTLEANGQNVSIYGDNATGKTTIFDAFTWLLFDKDSRNKKDFEIKPLDENGKVKQHGLNHEVEGSFKVNGDTVTLKRVYKEKWTKQRGGSEKQFTGHTTDYFIDGVPSNKKEFTNKVNEIIPEDIFKLLTNPLHFNQQLGWKERREILLDMAGNVTDEEVAEKSGRDDLREFINKLSGRDVEDHKKVIRAKQKEVNQEIDRIPVRIDEIQLSLPDISGLDRQELVGKASAIDDEIEAKQATINDMKSGGEVSNKRKALSDIDLEISTIKNEHDQQNQQEYYKKKASIQEHNSNIRLLVRDKETYEHNITLNKKRIEDLKGKVQKHRAEWSEENGKEFEHNTACECPTCGQSLPQEQLDEAREKAEEKFNIEKAEKLESIVQQATSLNNEVDRLEETIKKDKLKIEQMDQDVEQKQNKMNSLEEELKSLEEGMTDINDNPAYQQKQLEKENLEQEIEQLKAAVNESINAVQMDLQELKNEKAAVQADLNKMDLANRSNDRLDELEQKEKELAAEYELLEKDLFMIEEFTRKKVNLMESKINSQFKFATFKLFEEQINGGLKETCETLYDGVPYNGGLNNAARINVGLDIINTLNEYYNVSAPIFIDNSESVTNLIDIDAQTISLIVSEHHKQLEMDHQIKQSA